MFNCSLVKLASASTTERIGPVSLTESGRHKQRRVNMRNLGEKNSDGIFQPMLGSRIGTVIAEAMVVATRC